MKYCPSLGRIMGEVMPGEDNEPLGSWILEGASGTVKMVVLALA